MPAETEGLHDTRTRVTFFLPIADSGDEKAVRAVVDYLRKQRTTKRTPVSGFTHGALIDAGFTGYWWSPRRRKWFREQVVSFVVDYGHQLDDKEIGWTLKRLKKAIRSRYKRYGKDQEEIWLIAQRVTRYA